MERSKTMNLTKPIVRAYRTPTTPQYGMAADGYTTRSGAPTSVMIVLEGEKRPRRVMVWCFSNVGTCFVKIGGVPHIVSDSDIEMALYNTAQQDKQGGLNALASK